MHLPSYALRKEPNDHIWACLRKRKAGLIGCFAADVSACVRDQRRGWGLLFSSDASPGDAPDVVKCFATRGRCTIKIQREMKDKLLVDLWVCQVEPIWFRVSLLRLYFVTIYRQLCRTKCVSCFQRVSDGTLTFSFLTWSEIILG